MNGVMSWKHGAESRAIGKTTGEGQSEEMETAIRISDKLCAHPRTDVCTSEPSNQKATERQSR